MPLYKFYRIVPKDITHTDCYIGHTLQPLRKRFTAHCNARNTTSSKVLIERYGKEGLEIVLIHELDLADKEYARREERRLWEEVKELAVNHLRPWVSEEETKEKAKERMKQYRESHKEQRKQYYEANKEQLKEKDKQYYEANKEQRKERMKQYHEANKEQRKEQQKEYRKARKAIRKESDEA